ncbi:MAG: DUF4349 domain-containing protein [Bacteroidales bacterium]|nr:DUF4349 domain-containing protein [Bacteroidales bacterium]
MKKSAFYILLFVLCIIIQGCGKKESRYVECSMADSVAYDEERMPSSNQEVSVDYSKNLPKGRKLEKKASIRIVSKDVSQSRKFTDSLSTRYRSYIENEVYNSRYTHSYEITMRVPSNAVDSFISGMHGICGKIVEKSVSVVDRTYEYYDHESRRKTQEAMLERYRTMLKNTTKISDMLEVQNRIDQIQIEMDRVQGNMNVIDHNVSYSVVNITIEEEMVPGSVKEDKPGFWHDMGEAIVTGWGIVKAILVGIVTIWPLLILGGIAFYIWKRKRKK